MHSFHCKCMMKWSEGCPVCRYELEPEPSYCSVNTQSKNRSVEYLRIYTCASYVVIWDVVEISQDTLNPTSLRPHTFIR